VQIFKALDIRPVSEDSPLACKKHVRRAKTQDSRKSKTTERNHMRKVVGAKLHGIYVTEANLHYHGSITLDPDHCEAAGILPLEFVEIWNKNSGARISTYVILGQRGSRCCILNGAAARTCQAGDQLIICSSLYIGAEEIPNLNPKILTFDPDNNIAGRLSYSVSIDPKGGYHFSILNEEGKSQPVPLDDRLAAGKRP
jgi:aspartate 1-decarboxylase